MYASSPLFNSSARSASPMYHGCVSSAWKHLVRTEVALSTVPSPFECGAGCEDALLTVLRTSTRRVRPTAEFHIGIRGLPRAIQGGILLRLFSTSVPQTCWTLVREGKVERYQSPFHNQLHRTAPSRPWTQTLQDDHGCLLKLIGIYSYIGTKVYNATSHFAPIGPIHWHAPL
ncbi:hypothetical protein DM02DRAFT_38250 [Periconia macrospinosa]|uniref:Uncharacterized protein n=1 Tax=Periconia macrospinosa TaxID=97972 RepID=A0A2V1E6N0_9PLEO|nr:hypothetical protein DM02DRAFT_38250 [Periconia macrospinosa]